MKGAIYERFGEAIEIRDLPDPTPPDGGVVLEVGANGVCRSDWHGWMGHDDWIRLPHVPGHEMSGTVVAVGRGIDESHLGRRVIVPFVLGCGRCAVCRSGNHQVCEHQYQPGFSGWGGFARYVALPLAEENLVDLPESMSFATAAGLGCRFATAYHAVVDQAGVGDSASVAVWGCGGVGLSTVMIASSLGASVVAVDVDERALEMARSCGATETVEAGPGMDPVAAVRDLTDGGAAISFDTLGSTETCLNSIGSLRVRGRHVQVGLMVGGDERPAIPMSLLHSREIELHGSHGMSSRRYGEMLAMVDDGTLDPGMLVTETLDLAGGVRHLEAMASFPWTGFAVVTDYPS